MKPRAWIWSFAMILLAAHGALGQEAAASGLREYGSFPWIGSRTLCGSPPKCISCSPHSSSACRCSRSSPRVSASSAATSATTGSPRNSLVFLIAYSATAMGAVLVFFLTTLYPRFWAHMTEIFEVSMWIYVGLFFVESFTLYLYYYGWDRWKKGRGKIGHWTLGILLNVWGTAVLFIADSWLTYMMSPPADVAPDTSPAMVQFWSAFANATWMPINIHRLIANVVFGGSVCRRLRGIPLPLFEDRRRARTTGWATWGT